MTDQAGTNITLLIMLLGKAFRNRSEIYTDRKNKTTVTITSTTEKFRVEIEQGDKTSYFEATTWNEIEMRGFLVENPVFDYITKHPIVDSFGRAFEYEAEKCGDISEEFMMGFIRFITELIPHR